MIILSILHKVGKEGVDSFLAKLKVAKKLAEITDGQAVIIGPQFALDSDLKRPNSQDEYERIITQLVNISFGTNACLIPGTITYASGDEMIHSAPVFINGKKQYEFLKERDNGLVTLAENKGFVFRKGDCSMNRFELGGRGISVQICGDHGNQPVNPGDIELILAYDRNAGFYLRPPYNHFSRQGVLCDGYFPESYGFSFNPKTAEKQKIFEGVRKEQFLEFKI